MKKNIFAILLTALLLLPACAKDSNRTETQAVIPKGIEWVYAECDRVYYDSLDILEKGAEQIIRAKALKKIDQTVETYYDPYFKADYPKNGWTDYEIEVLEVIKGDLKVGNKIKFRQSYCIWEFPNGETQALFLTDQNPLNINDEILLFIEYNEVTKDYNTLGDINGIYYPPTEKNILRSNNDEINETDFHTNALDKLLFESQKSLYNDVMEKYFN